MTKGDKVYHLYHPHWILTVVRTVDHDVLVTSPTGFQYWIEEHWLRPHNGATP